MKLKKSWRYWTQDKSNPNRWENMPRVRRIRWAIFLSFYLTAGFALVGWVSVKIIGESTLWIVWVACALVFIAMFAALARKPIWAQARKKWFAGAAALIITVGVMGILVWRDYG